MKQAHVMIAGGGPVGMVSALVLAEAGIRVTVAESLPGLNEDFRASTFHPPTLNMLAPYGLTQDLIAQGLVARYTQQRDRHEGGVAEFDMQLLTGETDHPFRLQCEQWKLTNLILAKLKKIPHVQIHFNAKVESVEQTADKAITQLTIEGQAHPVESDYVFPTKPEETDEEVMGDAGHINNPLGGMGMNGGVHDAMKLYKKLLAVIQEGQSEDLLDCCERQRRTIAIEYINASTAATKKRSKSATRCCAKRCRTSCVPPVPTPSQPRPICARHPYSMHWSGPSRLHDSPRPVQRQVG